MRPDEHRALIELLHGSEDEQDDRRGPPDFDGGVRRPSLGGGGDPEADHNALIVGLCRGNLADYEWEQRLRNPGRTVK